MKLRWILSAVVRIWNSFDQWLTRVDERWAKLRYWQKGLIVGGGGHLMLVLLLIALFLIFVPVTPSPGSGDMGTASGWILLILYALLEIIPRSILYLFRIDYIYEPNLSWLWVVYLIYATLFYALIGIAVAKTIALARRPKSGARDDKQE
jgi:hypothetical protein